ncbi:peptidase [Streptomyces sp. NBC_00564]|uniref:peptidase n=1 Tax=Streptomyces sp. NBC_00564 TaxID=2903663 RepID=UPI00352F0EEC|nr:peptidase [Streptomyces sp. NBC_00564]
MRLRRSALNTLATVASLAIALTPASAVAQDRPTGTHTGTGAVVNTKSRAQLDAYWTPERIRQAKPMPAPEVVSEVRSSSGAAAEGTDNPVHVPATRPAVSSGVEAQASVWGTVGRLYFTIPGKGDYICSGNVVTSNNGSVVATARHCGFGDGGTNYRFAPNYNSGNAPYGWWGWRSAGWVTGGGQENDSAFLVLDTPGGRRVQDVVGSTGLGFNWSSNYAHIIGLPADKDYAVWCEGQGYAGPDGQRLMNNCNGLSGGASGGAWIENYQPDGSAIQTGAYSGSYGSAAATSAYGNSAYDVWNGAQSS